MLKLSFHLLISNFELDILLPSLNRNLRQPNSRQSLIVLHTRYTLCHILGGTSDACKRMYFERITWFYLHTPTLPVKLVTDSDEEPVIQTSKDPSL